MKYILSEEKLEKFIHKYMDVTYPELTQEKYDNGGMMYKDKNGVSVFLVTNTYVYFDGKMMYELTEMFNIEDVRDTLEPLGSWVEKKYGIKGRAFF